MERKYYLDLAASGLCLPVGADLVLREHEDHEQILRDGHRLGQVLQQAAERYHSPLALPVMDLKLEKAAMLSMLDVPADQLDTFHFAQPPSEAMMKQVQARLGDLSDPRLAAQVGAIQYIAQNTNLLPVGMTIGPFSLMTKLVGDPITPLYLAASGVSAAQDSEVLMIERCLELSTRIILRSLNAQIMAGAKLIFIAEPAANVAYISPNQIEAGSDVFDRYVMKYDHRIKAMLNAWGIDLLFHCCGELVPYMVRKFTELDPAILSLGSSRRLWEDAQIVPKTTVLYGNLPSKRFYSDDLMPVEDVENATIELKKRMQATGHPFILGSECDILSVPGHEHTIMCKAMAMIDAASGKAVKPCRSRQAVAAK